MAGVDVQLRSVFPVKDYTIPTPDASPNLGVLASPDEPFGGFNIPQTAADEAVKTARAWSSATRYLSADHTGNSSSPQQHDIEAFNLLLASSEQSVLLADWYLNSVSTHFREHVLPDLSQWESPIAVSRANDLINTTAQVLGDAQESYIEPLLRLSSSSRSIRFKSAIDGFRHQITRRWQSLVLYSLPRQRVMKTLGSALYQHMRTELGIYSNPEKCLKNDRCHCKINFKGFPLKLLHGVGLGGDLAQRALALATHRLLDGPAVERQCLQVDWSGQKTIVPRLKAWIEECFAPCIQGAIGALTGSQFQFNANDIERMAANAVLSLVRKRTEALFDYVKVWPASKGALLDIKEQITTGSTLEKASLCTTFIRQVQQRILHAGATTVEVLSIYVNVIHAFKLLDARGVLLDKVAGPLRSYLRSRDDTVSVIAASFLADIDADGNLSGDNDDKVCVDIARAAQSSSLEDSPSDRGLNWDDMEWIPDPIDAGSSHKYNKSEDVLSYVLGLFDQEDFIKEVTNVLAQHLLHATDPEFAKETRLVELFKSRFDPSKLQAAEVMLKDMRDSVMLQKRILPSREPNTVPTPRDIQAAVPDEGITLRSLHQQFEARMTQSQFLATVKLTTNRRGDLYFPKRGRLPSAGRESSTEKTKPDDPDISFRILSSFFWPQLRTNKFALPNKFTGNLEHISDKFAHYSGQRRLEWQQALGRMSVTLELEDRTISESDIPAWRVSVINAFSSDEADVEATLTASQLEGQLQMDAELVTDALSYWSNKRVLYQPSPAQYAVLERLDMDAAPTAQISAEEEAFSAVKSQDAVLRENAPMFEIFIANMLRNSGAKEVGGMMGIANMLKMVLPTFTYGEEEVLFLLGEMEARGEVARDGESWKVAK
jgi:anaphase-promoting complex subunit 2